MAYGISHVVGVIELDQPADSDFEHSLAPDMLSPVGCAADDVARVIAASDDDDVITADLRQLKRELRAELGFVLSRFNKSRRVEA